jgi:hypothetical protein
MRRSWFVVATALAVAACDRPPTEPSGPFATRPTAARFVGPSGTIVGIDLGTLPGDSSSEATYVADDGAVYGSSYAGTDLVGTRRYFRWTATTGMRQVASIPSPTAYPRPSLTAPDGRAVDERAANVKGEVTGQMCAPPGADGDWPCRFEEPPGLSYTQVFRWSAGAGVRNLEPPEGNPVDEPMESVGLAINRWGHIAGYRRDRDDDQPLHFFWAPVDTFVGFSPPGYESLRTPVLLNDNDQLVAARNTMDKDVFAYTWRPDLGLKLLMPPSCAHFPGSTGLAQNATTSVVGWGSVTIPGEELRCTRHAMLWRVPAVNRAGYPSVNVNPITSTSTISLSKSGGRYFQFYKGTQSTASGPYTELVDWGDGSTSSVTRATTGGTYYQSHVYKRTGTYWVRVYVKDRLGRWGVGERKVTVTP